MSMKLKIFVGSAIGHATEDFTRKVAGFKASLSADYDVLEAADPVASPQEDYRKSIQECVAACDMYIAICDIPAIGLGYELGTALEKYSKPTLAVAQEGADVSKMIQGIDHPMFEFRWCGQVGDIVAMVAAKRAKHFPSVSAEVCEGDVCAV